MKKNKILSLDIGSKNTGIAISDSTQSIAFCYSTIPTQQLTQKLQDIIQQENISKIIVGENLYQSKHFQVADFIKQIQEMQEVQALKIEIQTFNEDFSTQKAKEFAKEQKMTESEFKLKKDELAARIILQDYIDQL